MPVLDEVHPATQRMPQPHEPQIRLTSRRVPRAHVAHIERNALQDRRQRIAHDSPVRLVLHEREGPASGVMPAPRWFAA
jgi:hypothetical protein